MNTIKLFPLNDTELGFLFFHKRHNKGIKIREVAKAISSAENTISKFENGKCLMSMTKIIKYADFLELDIKFCVTS